MKISILTPDVSHNCFGRAWLLAELLKSRYAVEVIGPAFGDGVWLPLKDLCDFEMKIVKGFAKGRFEFKKMLRSISGDIIYASKPLISSFGVGLVKKALTGKRLLLDIDDWELGFGKNFYDSLPLYKKIIDVLLSHHNLNGYYYKMILDQMIALADGITVSGNTLWSMYGGTIIWHGRKSHYLNQPASSIFDLRKRYFPASDRESLIFGFIGTPLPHKGLDYFLQSFGKFRNHNIFVLIAGADDSAYCQHLRKKAQSLELSHKIIFLPKQPFRKIPLLLSLIDVIVIPQLHCPDAYGQVPAKIFDAMAMGKPMIVSSLPDILDILRECAVHVAPGNIGQMIAAIELMISDKEKRTEIGKIAKKVFDKKYDWPILESKLSDIIREAY